MKNILNFDSFVSEKLDVEIRAQAAKARKQNPGKSAQEINKKNVEEKTKPEQQKIEK